MAIVRCSKNHYYDNVKDETCPYCLKLQGFSGALNQDSLAERQTVFKQQDSLIYENQETEMYGESVDEGDKTISLYPDESENLFTVGWLVCMNGSAKGKSYVLHKGRNFAGRSVNMDIALTDDFLISRDKHFSVVYDPKSNRFYILAGTGRTYINNTPLRDEKELADGDLISAGASLFIFVSFCREGRTWL